MGLFRWKFGRRSEEQNTQMKLTQRKSFDTNVFMGCSERIRAAYLEAVKKNGMKVSPDISEKTVIVFFKKKENY